MRPVNVVAISLLAFLIFAAPAAADEYQRQRQIMLKEINATMKATAPVAGKYRISRRTMAAMAGTPRHMFVPEQMKKYAYLNRPLPIGQGQTISQPYIVALMTDLIDPKPGEKTLEIGTGSGYQAAVLSPLVGHVYTIEIMPQLAASAKKRLKQLGYSNVTVKEGDGYIGWEEHAPFDSVIVTAGADHIPPALIEQLKPGGRMIIPVGENNMNSQLTLVTKDIKGKVTTREALPVRFVPFTRSE